MSSTDSATHLSFISELTFLDQAAWTRFVRTYRPLMVNWCRRRRLQQTDAEDVSQNVLLKLIKTLPRFVYDPQRRFRAWLIHLVQNAVIDFWRTEKRRRGGTTVDEPPDLLDRLPDPLSLDDDPLMREFVDGIDHERGLIKQAIQMTLERLQPANWQAFWLTAVEGLSAAAAAEQLGMTVAAVYVARSRASKLLRDQHACLQGERPGDAEPPRAEAPVESVPGFRIAGEIGRGGMGVVYKAMQLSLERNVAVKMLRSATLADDAERRRFWTEVQAASQLSHPHIVPIYTVDEHRGRPYFSMKLIEGGSLARHLPRFRRDPRSAARLLAAVASAVAFAHRHRIVHRDLKPANILLDDGDSPLVADFGLAQRRDEVHGTEGGAVLGTPRYMAPEQAAGRAAQIGPASDVWALGVVLYEMLTGVPPFKADNALDTIVLVLEETPMRPREVRPGVPRELEAICLRCLEKDPARRFGSAEELAEALARAARRT